MKSRRKIWSLPLVLVTALLLVGLFTGAVLAQAAPGKANQIPDQELIVGENAQATGATEEIPLGDVDGDTTNNDIGGDDTSKPAYRPGTTGETLVYTVLTSDNKVAKVELSVGPDVPLITAWWDGLDGTDNTNCSIKAARLGFDVGDDGDDDTVVADENHPDRPDPENDGDTLDAEGLCKEYGEIGEDNQTQIQLAFHWDMLSGAEMGAAARAASEPPSDYMTPFAGLSETERTEVATWFGVDDILAMGSGTLTLTNDGIDGTAPDGKIGSATITLKVSDVHGRLIPPGDGRNTIGQSFTVDAVPTALEQIAIDPTAYTAAADDGIEYTEADADGNDTGMQLIDISIDADAETILSIAVRDEDDSALELNPYHQLINFSLSDGASLPFQIEKIVEDDAGDAVYNAAKIVPKPGATLSSAAPYVFTLSVNELGNASRNSDVAKVTVTVAVDNTAPDFAADTATTGTVLERAKDTEIETFSATDPNHQVLTYTISAKSEDDGAAAIRPSLVMNPTTGVLTTNAIVESGTAADGSRIQDQPDFEETPADDPETPADESDVETDNEHVFIVTVSDGTLRDTIEFTLTVTDEDEPAPGSDQKLSVDEGVGAAEAATEVGPAPLRDASGLYSIGQQIDNRGNITLIQDDILFGVNSQSGMIFLKEGKKLDFESGIVTYTLSILRGDAIGSQSGIVVISVGDVNEAPTFPASYGLIETGEQDNDDFIGLYVLESALVDDPVKIGKDAGGNPGTVDARFVAEDQDTIAMWNVISYDLLYDNDLNDDDVALDDLYTGAEALVKVDSAGRILVNKELDTDQVGSIASVELVLRAFDPSEVPGVDEDGEAEEALLVGTIKIKVDVIDTNVAPVFDLQSQGQTHAILAEDILVGHEIYTYFATDEDGDLVKYRLRSEDDTGIFAIGELDGVLTLATLLDYETKTTHTVEVQAVDTDGDTDEVVLTVEVTNVNDEVPMFDSAPNTRINVAENTPRGTMLSNYSATDADGDTVTYSLDGANKKSFMIDAATGDLMTLESLDYDSNTPCSLAGCTVTVIATDGVHNAKIGIAPNEAEPVVTIIVSPIEDSVSTLNVTKANPVPGTTRGDADTALGNTKKSESPLVPERPTDLPNKDGAPLNFVETDWASWGTVLRIEVTAQSPDANCGSGNECVVISLNSDSAGDTLQVEAYRMDTPAGAASNENKFVAAVMLVELDGDATDIEDASGDEIPVYAHGDGSVPRLQVDEEDEIEIEFYNLRGDIDVENEAPEISNFAPEHESAFDDPDVEYTFTVTDSHSGLPEPEDLPDVDGDDAYMPAVALISKEQCETAGSDASAASKARRAKLIKDGFEVVGDMAGISDDESLYCPGIAQDGEYDADIGGYGFAPIRDDKDFDEIDDGFDVETTIVLRENKIFYVTFVACDAAGNCSFFDPDGNDEAVELAEITVDTEDPVFVEARTGLTWDSTDNEYDDNRSYIQVIFNDLTKLNTETVEIDDFVVEGHSIKDVQVYENPDADDVTWGAGANKRYGAAAGSKNKRGIYRYRDLENVVFIELEDELLADETPDVTIVPNGVEDKAGNEQDDGDHEANDWISPAFTIVSIVSTRETSQDQILAGDDDEVTVVVTADERLDSTRPTVAITYVNAPAGRVDTKGVALCDTSEGADTGTRERGEIVHFGNKDCADNGAATGGTLNNSVEKVSNTEWVVTITEPKATGYYNFHISGDDRSSQKNPGSEGVSPGAIVTDFFDADGDVNVDDAIFFEGDINLPKPQVRVSGVRVENNEADVEFRSPLFVELDFAENHSDNCTNVDSDERMSNCMNENSEYAEDNFDDIVVTSFVLDGVDITDSVKTTDNQSFLVSLESISIGDHTAELQAVDQAGNVFEDTLEIDFEVNDRDPFEKRLSPGWNLVSLPGEPADSSIAAVFGPGVEVRTVYSYDPVIPGGWMVAVRETLDSDWQGDLTDINGQHGYWVLSDAIQDWEVSIPRLSGGAAGTGTPIQPPVIPLYAGWNLIPVTDISGNGAGGDTLSADVYLQSLDDGIDLARVLGFDTIRNQWETVLDPDMQMNNTLEIGAGYWIFVREATSLVPSGYVGGGGGGD